MRRKKWKKSKERRSRWEVKAKNKTNNTNIRIHIEDVRDVRINLDAIVKFRAEKESEEEENVEKNAEKKVKKNLGKEAVNVYIRNAYDPVKTAKKNEKKKEENVKLQGMQRIRRTRKIRNKK